MPRREVAGGSSLVAVAAALVAERGVAGAHLQAVAEAAGVSVGTVYNRFANKAALLRGVAEVVERDVVEVMAAAAPTTRPLRPALPGLASAVLQRVLASPASRVLAEQDAAGSAPAGHGGLVRRWIADRVRAAQAAGEVDEVDPDLVAALAYAVVLAAVQQAPGGRPDATHGERGTGRGHARSVDSAAALVGAALVALVPPRLEATAR